MEKGKKSNFPLIAGILFAVPALTSAIALLRNLQFYFPRHIPTFILSVISIASYAFVAYVLFAKRFDKLMVVAYGVWALSKLITFVLSFTDGAVRYCTEGYRSGTHFNIFCVLPELLSILGILATFFVVFIGITGKLPQYRKIVKQLWFLPAVLIASSFIMAVIVNIGCNLFSDNYWYYSDYYIDFLYVVVQLIIAAESLFTSLCIVYPNGLPKSAATQPAGNGYYSIVKHTLLLVFTFGIWYLIWIYRTTNFLNCVTSEEPRDATSKLLLCIFVPFYAIYWTCKSAERIDMLAHSKRIFSMLTMSCSVLSIICPIVAPILMQDKINTIAKKATVAAQ